MRLDSADGSSWRALLDLDAFAALVTRDGPLTRWWGVRIFRLVLVSGGPSGRYLMGLEIYCALMSRTEYRAHPISGTGGMLSTA